MHETEVWFWICFHPLIEYDVNDSVHEYDIKIPCQINMQSMLMCMLLQINYKHMIIDVFEIYDEFNLWWI